MFRVLMFICPCVTNVTINVQVLYYSLDINHILKFILGIISINIFCSELSFHLPLAVTIMHKKVHYYSFTLYAFRDQWRRMLWFTLTVNHAAMQIILVRPFSVTRSKIDATENSAWILLRMKNSRTCWRCMTMNACQTPRVTTSTLNE
jgi:hypothetical protein